MKITKIIKANTRHYKKHFQVQTYWKDEEIRYYETIKHNNKVLLKTKDQKIKIRISLLQKTINKILPAIKETTNRIQTNYLTAKNIIENNEKLAEKLNEKLKPKHKFRVALDGQIYQEWMSLLIPIRDKSLKKLIEQARK